MTETTKKKRRAKNKNYFTQEHEDAIVLYATTDDLKLKSKLYKELIGPVFDEMVDKIIFTYKFNNLPNIEILSQDCKTWLTTILNKFKPDKKKKAFSYFTVVSKNWFIHKVKKNAKAAATEVNYEDLTSELEQSNVVDVHPYEEFREYNEFWEFLTKEIATWDTRMTFKENDQKVYEAVKIVLSSVDDIEIFQKKAVYHYLREITNLNTKQVVNSLNKMRKMYLEFKRKWDNGKI